MCVCVFVRCMRICGCVRICEVYACLQCSCVFEEAQAYLQSQSMLAECKCVCGVCAYLQVVNVFEGSVRVCRCIRICRVHAYLQSVCVLAGSMRICRVSRFAEHFHAIPYLLAVLGYGRRRRCAFAFGLRNTSKFTLFCFSRRERTYLNLAQPVLCNRHRSHRFGDQVGV